MRYLLLLLALLLGACSTPEVQSGAPLNVIADHSVVDGFDVSQYQDPARWNWDRPVRFVIARASYGSKTPDPRFGAWASATRAHSVPFGAYHFFRQTQTAAAQFELFAAQVDAVGGIGPGDLPPVLDLEDNRANGDGPASAVLFNVGASEMVRLMLDRWGRVIIYMSAYFPDVLGGQGMAADWAWMRDPGIQFMIADYNTPPGKPRNPYALPIVIHQLYQQPVPEAYPVKGQAGLVDPDVLLVPIERVVLPDPWACVYPWSEL